MAKSKSLNKSKEQSTIQGLEMLVFTTPESTCTSEALQNGLLQDSREDLFELPKDVERQKTQEEPKDSESPNGALVHVVKESPPTLGQAWQHRRQLLQMERRAFSEAEVLLRARTELRAAEETRATLARAAAMMEEATEAAAGTVKEMAVKLKRIRDEVRCA